jgi:DNA-binding transcriptional ArsR family regulator
MKHPAAVARRPVPAQLPATKLRSAVASPEVAEADALLMSVVRDLLYVEDRTSDLPLRQLHVCATLYDGPLSMSKLSRKLGVSLSAMTQIADRLEAAGMVARPVFSSYPARPPGPANPGKGSARTPRRRVRDARCPCPQAVNGRPAIVPASLHRGRRISESAPLPAARQIRRDQYRSDWNHQ